MTNLIIVNSVLIVFLLFKISVAINITLNDYISDIAIYGNRAFLCVPNYNPSLIEVPWLGQETFKLPPKLKNRPLMHHKISKNESLSLHRCTALDIDMRYRLWVLDVPDFDPESKSNPKVIIYNIAFYSKIQTCELVGVSKKYLHTIVIDPVVNIQYGPRAYIGDAGSGSIIIYALKDHRWWTVTLQSSVAIHSKFMAFSKIKPILYVTGENSHHLHSVDLNEVRKIAGPPAILGNGMVYNVTSKYLGKKLGNSSGLVTDYKGFLYYYLIRDFAIVRWDTKKALAAENHDVILQSVERLPFVSQLFNCPQYNGNIWALVNNFSSYDLHEHRNVTKNRFIKINTIFFNLYV